MAVALDLDVLAALVAILLVAAPLELDVLAAVSGSGGVPAPRRWSPSTLVAVVVAELEPRVAMARIRIRVAAGRAHITAALPADTTGGASGGVPAPRRWSPSRWWPRWSPSSPRSWWPLLDVFRTSR
jgi:hypothetical protein